MQTQEQVLEGQIATQSRDLQQIPIRTINEQRLTRDQQAAATLYTTLSTRYEEAKLALASAIPDVKILDPAVTPRAPTSNSAPRIILLGFMASFGLALALAILLDQLDKRFRYTDQVTRELDSRFSARCRRSSAGRTAFRSRPTPRRRWRRSGASGSTWRTPTGPGRSGSPSAAPARARGSR